MGRHKQFRPLHEAFKRIDMKHGDKNQCWEWQGAMAPNPIGHFLNKRVQIRRLVYSLKHGLHYDEVPFLTFTCGNQRCVNPYHAVPFAAIAGLIARNPGYSHAQAASEVAALPLTKRGKKRHLTKRSKPGTYSGTKRSKRREEVDPDYVLRNVEMTE